MSYVIATPEMMAATAADLAGVSSALSEAHSAAAPSTVGLPPAAADEVSSGIAHLFSGYAKDFQGLAGRAAAFHEQFVQHLSASAGSYASAEATNTTYMTFMNWLFNDVLDKALGKQRNGLISIGNFMDSFEQLAKSNPLVLPLYDVTAVLALVPYAVYLLEVLITFVLAYLLAPWLLF
jgi:hypothetical protein